LAARNCCVEAIEILIAQGADAGITDMGGSSALAHEVVRQVISDSTSSAGLELISVAKKKNVACFF
jgi:hypothetical protein